jgi:hypothetical protein
MTVAASPELLKAHRTRVLTADDPSAVQRHLTEAFTAFADFMPQRAAA